MRSPHFTATNTAEGQQQSSSLLVGVHSPPFDAANAVEGNPQTSSEQSAQLQERDSGGSHGSAEMPVVPALPAVPAVPGQLVTMGNRLQLQTFPANQDIQLLSPANSVR